MKPSNHNELIWHPVSDELPKIGEYVLLSFSNYTLPCIGRYDGDENEGYAFYEGDDDKSLVSYGLFVSAWMPLPERVEGI